jgi:hypothetical protein
MAHRGAVGGLDHLQALGPQRALGQRGLHQFPQCEVGVHASEPPRRMQALPPLMASEAASMVTFGRLSKIVPKTPSRTRICPTLMPRGRPQAGDSANGSGMAAICSQPSAAVGAAARAAAPRRPM